MSPRRCRASSACFAQRVSQRFPELFAELQAANREATRGGGKVAVSKQLTSDAKNLIQRRRATALHSTPMVPGSAALDARPGNSAAVAAASPSKPSDAPRELSAAGVVTASLRGVKFRTRRWIAREEALEETSGAPEVHVRTSALRAMRRKSLSLSQRQAADAALTFQ